VSAGWTVPGATLAVEDYVFDVPEGSVTPGVFFYGRSHNQAIIFALMPKNRGAVPS
jgi:hypothetical protein